ncbi:MAG: sigma-70 family RNA polymerase sigma factor [Leptospiraceae bacterium]|nr:sigma-70 family RNA polymerase sigma factor [Leptospiraceae bacterium]
MPADTATLNTDRSLSLLTRKNDVAVELLIDRYYQLYFNEIFIFIDQHIRCYEDSQDLTHDVFAKALAYLQRSEIKIENPRAWLYRIARTHCIDRIYRKRKLKSNRFKPGEEQDIAQPSPFENSILDQAMIDSVLEWVDKNTSEVERRIFELKILCGLTLAEVGRTVQCDASTVSRILSNLVARIKREFI